MDRRDLLVAGLSGSALLTDLFGPGVARAQPGPQSTFERIRSSGVLRVAALVGEEPYFSKDIRTNAWTGACVEMAKDIAAKLNAKAEFVETNWSGTILGLQSGRIDLGFSLTASPDRALAVDFTRPLFVHSFTVITRDGFPAPRTWDDLNKEGVRIAVDLGSTQEIIARRYAPKAAVNAFRSTGEVVMSVVSKRNDCLVLRATLAISAKKKNPGLGELVIPQPNLSLATNMGVPMETDKRLRDFLSVWADYNRSLGQIREWMLDGFKTLGLSHADIPADIQF